MASSSLATVSFALAGNPDGLPVTKTVDVRLNNNPLLLGGITIHPFSFNTTGKTKANMGWTDQSFLFTSASRRPENMVILTFISTTTGFFGPAIDNVRIVDKGPDPVPIPGSLLLFLSGLVPVFRILKSSKAG